MKDTLILRKCLTCGGSLPEGSRADMKRHPGCRPPRTRFMPGLRGEFAEIDAKATSGAEDDAAREERRRRRG